LAPDEWIRLLMLAMDHAVWSGLTAGRELADRCRRELSEFTDRELALADEYERLAFLIELASDPHLQDGSAVPANLRSLLQKSWVASDAELRCEFLEVVAGWVDAPEVALQIVTNLA